MSTTLPTNGHVKISLDDLDALSRIEEPQQLQRKRLLHADELDSLPPVEYWRPGIPKNGTSAPVGGAGTGKSFYALGEIALPMAQEHTVIYIAAEGVSGYAGRKRAWCTHHKSKSGGLHFWTEPVNMLDGVNVQEFIDEIQQLAPQLIVIDTLARCMVGGDENSAKDMGLFVAACDKVRIATGATILIVHHTGKNGDYRGSSALKGAVDTMIELKNEDDAIEVSCAKIKDGEPFAPQSFKLIQVLDTGSCVLVPADRVYATKEDRLSEGQRKMLKFLAQPIFEESGTRARDIEHAGVMQRSSVFEVLSALKRRSYISQGQKGDPYYVTEEGRAALEREHSTRALPHPNAQVQQSSNSPTVVQQTLSPEVRGVHPPFRGVDPTGLETEHNTGRVKR